MIAVIFEAIPGKDKMEAYLDIAARLKTELNQSEGFISVERFQSMGNPGKYLSLSFWKDEASVEKWRNTLLHRKAQQQGRDIIFTEYRLRVAEVTRDYGKDNRAEAPADSHSFHH